MTRQAKLIRLPADLIALQNGVEQLEKWKPGLFCFNDTEVQTAADHERLQGVYERLFPAPSSFERKT